MYCPKCEFAPLKAGKVTGSELELDQCIECAGIWFDRGELAKMLGLRVGVEFTIPSTAKISFNRQCPRCSTGLIEFCYPETTTPVDGCEQCKGIWLDDKEWMAIKRVKQGRSKITAIEDIKFDNHIPGLKGTLLRMIERTINRLHNERFSE